MKALYIYVFINFIFLCFLCGVSSSYLRHYKNSSSNVKLNGNSKRCNYKNPAYASILANDIKKFPSELVYSSRPFISLNQKNFYFDELDSEICYFNQVKILSEKNPRVAVYSYFSGFENYKNSFNNQKIQVDGYIFVIRGTKTITDLINDSQLLLNYSPSYFKQILQLIKTYSEENPIFLDKLSTFIGHSLGGLLSDMLSVYYNKESITFDAAGSKKFINQMVVEYQIPKEQVDNVINNKIIGFISMPDIINSYFEQTPEKVFVIYPDPVSICEVYFYRDFKKFLKKTPERISTLKSRLWWNIYYHMVFNMRDSILSNFKKTGYEIIEQFNKNEINSLALMSSKKNSRFFEQFYKCVKDYIGDQTYESFVEERLEEYSEDLCK